MPRQHPAAVPAHHAGTGARYAAEAEVHAERWRCMKIRSRRRGGRDFPPCEELSITAHEPPTCVGAGVLAFFDAGAQIRVFRVPWAACSRAFPCACPGRPAGVRNRPGASPRAGGWPAAGPARSGASMRRVARARRAGMAGPDRSWRARRARPMAIARSARSAMSCSSAIRFRAISRSGYIMVSLAGGRGRLSALTRQGLPPRQAPGRDQPTPFPRGGGRGQTAHTGPGGPGGRRARC